MTILHPAPQLCNAWENRIALARDGWTTTARINDTGVGPLRGSHVSVGLWAKTWAWAGWISEVSFHQVAIVALDEEAITQEIERQACVMREGCMRARATFPDTIPAQDHAGGRRDRLAFVVNDYEMRQVGAHARDFFPTENIAPATGRGSGKDNGRGSGDGHSRTKARVVLRGMHIEDSLNHFADRYRLLRDCKDRNWQYEARLIMRSWGDITPAYQPVRFSTDIIEETVTTALIKSASNSLWDLFAAFGPGGIRSGETANGLPPGFLTRQEKFAQQDARTKDLHSTEEQTDAAR